MPLKIETAGDVTVVQLAEKLNSSTVDSFRSEIAPVLQKHSRIVFDLSRLMQMDSMGLGTMLHCLKEVRNAGGDLKVCALTRQIQKLFELVRMNHVFEIYATREDAIDAFPPGL